MLRSGECNDMCECEVFRYYTLTSVCVRALPVGHLWSQTRVADGYCC